MLVRFMFFGLGDFRYIFDGQKIFKGQKIMFDML